MKTLIMLSGKLHSGKNTVARMLTEWLSGEEALIAYTLKNNCRDDFKDLSAFMRSKYQLLREKLGAEDLEHFRWMDVRDEHFFEDKTDLTRILLQIYGLEIFRNRVDSDYWIKAFLKEAVSSPSSTMFVTDLRFPGEILCSHHFEGIDKVITVRVDRPGKVEEVGQSHFSEVALDDYRFFDYRVVNDGSLEDLSNKVSVLAERILRDMSDDAG